MSTQVILDKSKVSSEDCESLKSTTWFEMSAESAVLSLITVERNGAELKISSGTEGE